MQPTDQQDHETSTLAPPETGGEVPANSRPLSARTLQFYARDWAHFVAWCRSIPAAPLPADAIVVAAYLTAEAARLSPGALARRLAAIAHQHQRQGLASPHTDPAVKAVLKTVRRQAAPHRDPPPSPAQLARMIASCPGDLAGLRDRALLLLMQATGLGRGALVRLDAEILRRTGTGCELQVDMDGAPHAFRLTRHAEPGRCPVNALDEWLRVSGTSFGPVFRKIDRWGNIEHHRLGADAVRRILARRTPARPRRRSGGGRTADLVTLA